MGDVIDVRPDRFLRELREGTPILVACKVSGMEHTELTDMLETNEKFRVTVRECILEYAEEQMRYECAESIKKFQAQLEQSIKEMRHATNVSLAVDEDAENDG